MGGGLFSTGYRKGRGDKEGKRNRKQSHRRASASVVGERRWTEVLRTAVAPVWTGDMVLSYRSVVNPCLQTTLVSEPAACFYFTDSVIL